ncbi:hypothetical protein ACWIF8_01660 [Micromonospora chalcea]
MEGDDKGDFIRLGEHALRVRTDDDEVDLAYYFVDDDAAVASPDRLAFLLHDTWPLPASAGGSETVFRHSVPVRAVRLAPPGTDCTFSVRLCWQSPDLCRNLDLLGAIQFPGVSLPDLATHLAVDDPGSRRWPHDVRLLRALVAPGEHDVGRALERYAQLPGYAPSPASLDRMPTHEAVHREMVGMLQAERPTESLIRLDTHLVQVARHIDDFFGFDQWILFDNRWAAVHPELARSLLRYAAHWDPYESRHEHDRSCHGTVAPGT